MYIGTIVQTTTAGRVAFLPSVIGITGIPSVVVCTAQSFNGFMRYDYDNSLSSGYLTFTIFTRKTNGGIEIDEWEPVSAGIAIRFCMMVYM